MTKNEQHRIPLKQAKRVVIKAGSKVLVQSSGHPDAKQVERLVDEMATFQAKGGEIAFVSSGAIGAGLDALGMTTRPKSMADLQMAAAVGQPRLTNLYAKLFAQHKCHIGQILLTHDGLKQRERHLNARNTLLNLIANKIIPVINENDTISTEEIKFGDNDVLAALVAILIEADALILLSSTDGFRQPDGKGKTKRLPFIEEVDDAILRHIVEEKNHLSTGGMTSKLESAQIATENGIPVIIANGRKNEVITRILNGKDEGTLLIPKARSISKRKRWIAFFNRSEGTIQIDDGALKALEQHKSLLPVGIINVKGTFEVGAMITIQSTSGQNIGRGLTEYNSKKLNQVMGKQTSTDLSVAIHRDNMVIL